MALSGHTFVRRLRPLSRGGFNRSAQHLLVLLDQGVAHGDITDMVHGSAEGGAVGALEEWVEWCSDLAGPGSAEQCSGLVDPTDCTWPWTSAVDGEPGAQAQRRQPMLPCQPGGQEGLGTGASSQALSSGTPQRATMACGAEAHAAMVTGADLWLAEAGVPDRPEHANISRSDLSQSLHPDPRRAEEGAEELSGFLCEAGYPS